MTSDTEEERIFRENYVNELKSKRQDTIRDELEEERRKVNQQAMKTPGRRGEQIKNEEIDREIVRRYNMSKNKQ